MRVRSLLRLLENRPWSRDRPQRVQAAPRTVGALGCWGTGQERMLRAPLRGFWGVPRFMLEQGGSGCELPRTSRKAGVTTGSSRQTVKLNAGYDS